MRRRPHCREGLRDVLQRLLLGVDTEEGRHDAADDQGVPIANRPASIS
jgi:hypothetical protein